MGSYETIIEKLDAFVRKYYTNKLIKASIGFFTILFLLILAGNTLEFIFYLDPTYKKIILFLSSASLLYLLVFKILYFGLKIKRLGKVISREEAAILIGKHFPEVSDKLTNTIELQKQLDLVSNKALLLASISQKTESLSLVPFQKAIDLSQNKKYLKFLLPPLAIFIVLIFAAPGFIINSSSRILDYNTAYEKPAPFQFIIENNELIVNESESITLKIKIEGDVIPQDLYLIQKESKFKMEKLSSQKFQYTLENMQQTSSVQVEAAGFKSKPIVIKVIPKPQITNFEVFIDYPAYLGKKDELLENIGDLLVPEGSVLTWNLETENVGMMNFFMEKKLVSTEVKSNKAQFKKQALQSYKYQLFPTHPLNLPTDTLNYQVQIIADQYPKILVEQEIDSITAKSIFFSIKCEDDYGLTRLFLKYKKPNDAKYQSVPIALKAGQNSQQQFYKWDLSFIKTDESIEYFLELYDNDGIHGPKHTKSFPQQFSTPSEKELNQQLANKSDELVKKLQENIKRSEELQKDAKRLNEKLLEQKTLRYEEKRQIQELIKQQKNIEREIQEIQDSFSKKNELERSFKQGEDNLIEKQKQLEELFNNVLDEKTKELIKDLEKLLEQNNKELSQEQLQKMQKENQNLSKEMDRMLEMLKQLEFDKKLSEKINELNDLAKEQQELSEKTKNSKNHEDLINKQKEIDQKVNDLKEELSQLQKDAEEMEEPPAMEDPKDDIQKIEEKNNQAKEELAKKNNSKASSKQKESADKMKELAQKMQEQQMKQQGEELDLNIQALRQILDNLITASFNQEKTMEQLKRTSSSDPLYVKLTQNQKSIRDDMKKVEDSLYALSKKVVMIKSFINKEIASINNNIDKGIEALAERRTPEALARQQYSMTAMNNLAVLLSEILQQMQSEAESQKKNGKPGAKPGKKPGKGSGSSISKMQEQLNKQIEELKKAQQPGPGKDGKQGGGKTSEALAKMAAQQQAIRSALSQLEKEMNKDGQGGNAKQLSELKREMEKTETDLYNKNLTQETINRQKEIMTRLLEAEESLRERELDEKRQAEEGKNWNEPSNVKFEEYKKKKERELEIIRTVPPNLQPYYKEKVDQYFKRNP